MVYYIANLIDKYIIFQSFYNEKLNIHLKGKKQPFLTNQSWSLTGGAYSLRTRVDALMEVSFGYTGGPENRAVKSWGWGRVACLIWIIVSRMC